MKGGIRRNFVVHLLSAMYCASHVTWIISLSLMECLWIICYHTCFCYYVKCLANGHVWGRCAWCQNSSFLYDTISFWADGLFQRTEPKEPPIHFSAPASYPLLWPQTSGQCHITMACLCANTILTFLFHLFIALQITQGKKNNWL